MTTNPRPRRRVRRRNHRIAVGALVLVLGATALVLPAGAASRSAEHYTASPEASLADIQAYWARALPETYRRDYEEIPADRIHPYSSDDPPPGCGTRGTTPYRQVAGNAFYCEPGDFIAYDEEVLIPRLREQYGDIAVGLVLAHEFGHAIQGRVGAPSGAYVYMELQADCFAGAWTGRIAEGSDTELRASDDDLDRALAGFLDLRDPSGTEGGAHGAHGNAFDRAGAFQDGLAGGADACRAYESDPPAVTQAGFASAEDQAVNGDPPLAESLPMVTTNLDAYWDDTVRRYDGAPELVAVRRGTVSCGDGSDAPDDSDGGVLTESVIYCADRDAIVYATAALGEPSEEIGDMAAGVLVASAWASAVQHDLGVDLGTARARAASDCLAGAWAGAVERGEATDDADAAISFSPGDLDEILAVYVRTAGAGDRRRGTVLDRLTRFRTGFADGPAACLTT